MSNPEYAPQPSQPEAAGRNLVSLLEAMLFAAGRTVTAEELADAAGLEVDAVREGLAALASQIEGRGIQLLRLAGGWRLVTRAEFAEPIRVLLCPAPSRLTPARLETLAVIAYRQPATRAEVDAVRGVDSQGMIRQLLELELIEPCGRRRDKPGRPLQYATTERFLEVFGLAGLDDLPTLEEMDA